MGRWGNWELVMNKWQRCREAGGPRKVGYRAPEVGAVAQTRQRLLVLKGLA